MTMPKPATRRVSRCLALPSEWLLLAASFVGCCWTLLSSKRDAVVTEDLAMTRSVLDASRWRPSCWHMRGNAVHKQPIWRVEFSALDAMAEKFEKSVLTSLAWRKRRCLRQGPRGRHECEGVCILNECTQLWP